MGGVTTTGGLRSSKVNRDMETEMYEAVTDSRLSKQIQYHIALTSFGVEKRSKYLGGATGAVSFRISFVVVYMSLRRLCVALL